MISQCGLRLATVCASVALTALAAEPDRAAFYRPPQLFVMTGFIANTTNGTWGTDFVGFGDWTPDRQRAALAEWNKGLGRDYDPDRELLAFKNAGATGIIFYDKWHDGNVPHDTKLTTYKTERDLVAPTIRAARKLGLKIVIYYSVGLDSNPDPRFKDWVCRDVQGRPMGRAFPTDWMSFHSPYRQYVIDHLVEIMRMNGRLDGLWLDLYTQPVPSYDTYTKQAFAKRYGKPLENATHAQLIDFDIETKRDFLLDISKAVSAVQPDIALTFNGSGMTDIAAPKHADRVDRLVDFFSMEGHRWSGIDHGANAGHNVDRPFEVGILFSSSWYVPMDDNAPPPSMTEDEAVESAAWALVRGSNVYAAMTPGHSGRFDREGDVRLLAAAGDWLTKHKVWIENSTPYSDIGVVRGTPTSDVAHPPSIGGLWPITYHNGGARGTRPGDELDLAVREGGYFSELVGTAFERRPIDWKAYRMLMLPENALLSSDTAQAIREYVRRGGKLLAFGNASRFDAAGRKQPQFALADVFGATLDGELPGYKQLRLQPDSGLASRLRVNPGALRIKATTGRVLATWRSAGDTPAIVENQFGKGTVLYVSADEASSTTNPDLFLELTGRLIGPPPVAVEGGRKYSLLMNRHGSDLILYMFNRSSGSRAYVESGLVPDRIDALPPDPVRITVDTHTLGEIARVEMLPAGSPVRFSRRSGEIQVVAGAAGSVTALRLVR
jgi:hypothetical protein